MNKPYKTVASSNITISELMLPSHTNLVENTWWLYIFLDQVAFASASKFSGNYCVTASGYSGLPESHRGELVTKASVNYVGNSSMI
jgi:acyl-CoA hydrolase